MSNLNVNGDRLWDSLMETARFGGTADGGIARLTLSVEDKAARNWFAGQCRSLGMSVAVDEVGNMFATRPGRRSDLAPVAMGSHLDTQPTGGKFDGVLGVLAALEVVRTLDEADYRTEAPLMIANWTNEEGSRYAPAMLGSGCYAGAYSRDYCDSREDVNGETFATALEAIGYRGEVKAGAVEIGAMFELHIEQGPILEVEGAAIGVVQGVQGMRWFDLEVYGTAAHTGSTPMGMRRNALLGMARIIDGIDRIAKGYPDAVGSIGFLDITPNSHNVIANKVRATIDLRHHDDAVLDPLEAEVKALIAAVVADLDLTYALRPISRVPAIAFHPDLIASVRRAAEAAGLTMRDIISGAGHDAAHVAAVAPTTMIFVPSEKGLSHNPAEFTSKDQCNAGAQVLLGAVLDYDRRAAAAQPVKGAA